MDPTLIVALAGIAGTLLGALGGPWLQARHAARHEREARLREQRIALYTDALGVAEDQMVWLDWLTDPYRHHPWRPGESTSGRAITVRMVLLASPEVEAAWRDFSVANEVLRSNLLEASTLDRHGIYANPDSPDVARVHSAIDRLTHTTRADLEPGTRYRRRDQSGIAASRPAITPPADVQGPDSPNDAGPAEVTGPVGASD